MRSRFWSSKFRDLTGLRFGRLTVVKRGPNRGQAIRWWCRCDCGAGTLVLASGLTRTRDGRKSCGCSRLKHGHARNGREHPLYGVWQTMIKRCENGRAINYPHYGGRGIRVCERWRHDFAAFLKDVGERPTPQHSLDRINNDGHYEPGNVRWATRREQALNSSPRRRTRTGLFARHAGVA